MPNAIQSLRPGVIQGRDLPAAWRVAKTNGFALPAVNVTNSDSINAVLETAVLCRSPVIVQISYKGAQAFAGPKASGSEHEVAVLGATLAARYVHAIAKFYPVPIVMHTDHAPKSLLPWIDGLLREDQLHYEQFGFPLFSSHMIDLSLEPLEDNIATSVRYFERFAALGVGLEVEVGCTGGKEDGMDHRGLARERLYSHKEDVLKMFDALRSVDPNFTIAATFGNVHGVYAPGNVELKPALLSEVQAFIRQEFSLEEKPLSLVFHGSSGSSDAQLKEAVSYGVVKVNIDTDIQWAWWRGVKDYYQAHAPYLQAQIGNPEGPTLPNKNYYDPRAWTRAAQQSLIQKLTETMVILNSYGQLSKLADH